MSKIVDAHYLYVCVCSQVELFHCQDSRDLNGQTHRYYSDSFDGTKRLLRHLRRKIARTNEKINLARCRQMSLWLPKHNHSMRPTAIMTMWRLNTYEMCWEHLWVLAFCMIFISMRGVVYLPCWLSKINNDTICDSSVSSFTVLVVLVVFFSIPFDTIWIGNPEQFSCSFCAYDN